MATEYRNNAKVNVVTPADGVSTSLLHPPLPSPRFATPNRAADIFPLFCSWLSLTD
jgi:hypothetical protein